MVKTGTQIYQEIKRIKDKEAQIAQSIREANQAGRGIVANILLEEQAKFSDSIAQLEAVEWSTDSEVPITKKKEPENE